MIIHILAEKGKGVYPCIVDNLDVEVREHYDFRP